MSSPNYHQAPRALRYLSGAYNTCVEGAPCRTVGTVAAPEHMCWMYTSKYSIVRTPERAENGRFYMVVKYGKPVYNSLDKTCGSVFRGVSAANSFPQFCLRPSQVYKPDFPPPNYNIPLVPASLQIRIFYI